MIIAKFGGTSIGSPEKIKTLGKIVKEQLSKNPILVVSATSGTTDLLLSIPAAKNKKTIIDQIKKSHLQIVNALFRKEAKKETLSHLQNTFLEIQEIAKNKNFSKATIDKLISRGEVLSSFIISSYLQSIGIDAVQILATDLILTNDNFGRAEFLPLQTEKRARKILLPIVKKQIVPVITGFIGSTRDGAITTLGRGGSDYSATIIGYCLKAQEVQIWTDVDGIFTTDPRMVKNAKLIKSISYKEASELAAFGAKVLHPRTIKPAIKRNIPMRVLNTDKPTSPGTLISEKPDITQPITAISFKKKLTLVNIYSTDMLFTKGYLAKIFGIFAKNNVSIDLVSVSEVSVSATIDNDEMLDKVVAELAKFSQVIVKKDLSLISLVGEGLVTIGHNVAEIFNILDKENIEIKMISLGATDINVSVVVKYPQLEKAVVKLHNGLLLKTRIPAK